MDIFVEGFQIRQQSAQICEHAECCGVSWFMILTSHELLTNLCRLLRVWPATALYLQVGPRLTTIENRVMHTISEFLGS